MSVKKKIDGTDFNAICRLCLATSNESDSINIFNTVENCSLPLRIMACVALEISQSDPLPKNVCRECRYSLEKFYYFRKKAKNSDVKLRRYLRQLNSGKDATALDDSDTEFEEEHATSINFLKQWQNEQDLEHEKEEQERVARFNDALDEAISVERKRVREEESKKFEEARQSVIDQESKKFEEAKAKFIDEQEQKFKEAKKILIEQQNIKFEKLKLQFMEKEQRKKDLTDAESLINVLKDERIDSEIDEEEDHENEALDDELDVYDESEDPLTASILSDSDTNMEPDNQFKIARIESRAAQDKNTYSIEDIDDGSERVAEELPGDDDLAMTVGSCNSSTKEEYIMPHSFLKQEDKNYDVEYLDENSNEKDELENLQNDFENSVITNNLDLAEEYKMRKEAGQSTQILVRNHDGELICVEFVEDDEEDVKETNNLIEGLEEKQPIENLNDEDNGELKIFACDKCPKRFPRRIQLFRHASVHGQKQGWICLYCDKWFPSKSSQERHTRIHTGEKPFKCEECGRAFIQKEILKRHMMIHTGIKPFNCEFCGKSFTQKEILRQHINKHHTAEPVISFHHCPKCPKSFHHASGLSRHLLVHTGRKFSCPVCGREFNDKSALKRHTNALHKDFSPSKLDTETV